MTILTKPTVVKGQAHTFSISQADLIVKLTALSAPARFLAAINWSSISLNYANIDGQVKSVIVNPSTLNGTFKSTTALVSNMNIVNIVVYDLEGSHFTIPRASLTASEFDISFGAAAPTGTAYRYVKVQLLESFAGGASGSSLGSSVSMDELQLKYDGAVQSLAGKTISGYSPAAGSISVSNIANDASPTNNTGYNNWPMSWQPEITIDLGVGVSKVVTDVLMSPQGDLGAGQVYNVPKKFEVFGSNDGTTFTSIKVVDQTALTYGQSAGQWYPGQLTSFSLAASPAVALTGRYVGLQFTATDKTYGGSVVVTEIQIIQGGVAKTFSTIGATPNNYSNFNAQSGANMSDGNLTTSGGYIYGTITPMSFTIDLGSVQTIDGIAIAVSGFGVTSDGMEHVPTSVNILAHDTNFNYNNMTVVATKTFVRSDFTANTLKNIVP